MSETFLLEKETSTKEKRFMLLDVFCGLGGVSDGFAMEGFDVLGIDIEDMPSKGYKHKFLRTDIRDLKGEDFRGYDVIWGSPPCRDFSQFAVVYGRTWKNPSCSCGRRTKKIGDSTKNPDKWIYKCSAGHTFESWGHHSERYLDYLERRKKHNA